MLDKGYQQLNIDPEFKALIRPLNKEEYSTLEANLILDGCREPIVTWMGYIVDGHNRYEICNRLHIPYGVVTYDFKSRDEAIVWICNNQLGRRNITEETRKYLIGKQYEAEKATNARNALGSNQYQRRLQEGSHAESYVSEEGFSRESGRRTANRIGEKYHVSSGAVQKYSKYSQALDKLGEKVPELVPLILAGTYKISHENLIVLAEMTPEEIRNHVGKGIGSDTPQFKRYSESRLNLPTGSERKKPGPVADVPSIKKMPAYDPDAEVKGLTLTIPSWRSSIERTKTISDLNAVSLTAKELLREALSGLREEVDKMLRAIEEDV